MDSSLFKPLYSNFHKCTLCYCVYGVEYSDIADRFDLLENIFGTISRKTEINCAIGFVFW